MGFAAFAGQKYLNLETFKKSGDGVKTPVWFAADPAAKLDSGDARLYVYTIGESGKVKRIRNNPNVKVAPCNASGKVKGDWVAARAEIISGSDAAHGMQLLNRKWSFPFSVAANSRRRSACIPAFAIRSRGPNGFVFLEPAPRRPEESMRQTV